MRLQAVFIDVGNTLLEEKPARWEIYARAGRERGLAVSGAEMRALMGRAHAELPRVIEGGFRYSDRWFRAFVERIFVERLGLPRERLDDLLDELFATFSDPATFRLFPGALALLALLREAGLAIGLVSNWSARLPELLERLELAPRVDLVFCSALEGLEKPDPEVFRVVLGRARVPAAAALHAGDHPVRDVAAAEAAGLEAVLVDHAGTAELPPGSTARRVRSLAELGDRVRERLA